MTSGHQEEPTSRASTLLVLPSTPLSRYNNRLGRKSSVLGSLSSGCRRVSGSWGSRARLRLRLNGNRVMAKSGSKDGDGSEWTRGVDAVMGCIRPRKLRENQFAQYEVRTANGGWAPARSQDLEKGRGRIRWIWPGVYVFPSSSLTISLRGDCSWLPQCYKSPPIFSSPRHAQDLIQY
jgi:hypothetical protein